MAEIRSALAEPAPPRGDDALELAEITGRDLVQIAGWPPGFDRAAVRVAETLGCPVPADTRTATSRGDVTIFGVGPQRLWVAAPWGENLSGRLRTALSSEEAAVTDLGHSRTVLRLSGPAVARLDRCVAVDLDAAVFPPGRFAQTPVHQVGLLLHRQATACFDLYVPRSYAVSVRGWLETVLDGAG